MRSLSSGASGLPHLAIATGRRAIVAVCVAVCVAVAVAGCTTAIATPTPAPVPTTDPTFTPAPPTPTPTLAPIPTILATAPDYTAVPPTPTADTNQVLQVPTKPPVFKVTAPPAPGDGLCKSEQLSLSITAWIGDVASTTVYAHLTATNVSSTGCNMRGISEAQIVNGSGAVIADAGSGAARVATGDPVYMLAPGGTINTITGWGNWCVSAPSQNITVAMIEPFGLGRVAAPANGAAPVPACATPGTPTSVSSEAWLP
jgi:hypothetical protein